MSVWIGVRLAFSISGYNMIRSILFVSALFLWIFSVEGYASEGSTHNFDPHKEFTSVDSIYRAAILSDGDIDKVLARLKNKAGNASLSKSERAECLLRSALLKWRDGNASGAHSDLDKALALHKTSKAMFLSAQLYEAEGDLKNAKYLYRKSASLGSGIAKQEALLRLAMIDSDVGVKALIKLARESDVDFRNRSAVIIAMLGNYAEAIALYELPEGAEASEQLKFYLRSADWGVRANDLDYAQNQAWQAALRSDKEQDLRYSLSVLVDIHNKNNSMDTLIDRLLERKEALKEPEKIVLIEALRDTGQYDRAIAILSGNAESLKGELKRQLIEIYKESGKDTELVNEFSRMISASPDDVEWYLGLAQYYLDRGKEAQARRVCREFIHQNGVVENLLNGALGMQRLGFYDLAVEAAEKSKSDESSFAKSSFFLFELYMSTDQKARAEAVLKELDEYLPSKDKGRVALAECYDRLNDRGETLRILQDYAGGSNNENISEKIWMSELQIGMGKTDEALSLLLELLPEVLPVQRGRVEKTIVATAEQSGKSSGLIKNLKLKINRGEASEFDVGLLIRFFLSKGQSEEALAVVDDYFSGEVGSNVERLSEKGRIYRRLGDYQGFDRIAKELYEADPDNALLHIRSRIVNYIEHVSRDSHQDFVRGLEELLEMHENASNSGSQKEFEVGILDVTGQRDKAISLVKNIMAQEPDRIDNLFLLGDFLKKENRLKEAALLFQYLIESADTDPVFAASLDAILNVSSDRNTLLWAKRAILLRMVKQSDEGFYFNLLNEVAIALEDADFQMSVLENFLPGADGVRSTVLRELITLTGMLKGSIMTASANISPNSEKNLEYSRKLVALGQKLPPSIYLDMAESLLASGNAEAALKAVNMALGHTSSAKLSLSAGRIFAVNDQDGLARVQLLKAWMADPTNIEVGLELAQCEERLGLMVEAKSTYSAVLGKLLRNEAESVDDVSGYVMQSSLTDSEKEKHALIGSGLELPDFFKDKTKSDLYRGYYATIRDGLVRMLHEIPDASEELIKRYFSEFRRELDAIKLPSGRKYQQLFQYPRLMSYSQFVRYASFATGKYSIADELDGLLLAEFPDDPILERVIPEVRCEWGVWGFKSFVDKHRNALSPETVSRILANWRDITAEKIAGFFPVKLRDYEMGDTGGGYGEMVSSWINQKHDSQIRVAKIENNQSDIYNYLISIMESGRPDRAVIRGEALLDSATYRELCEYVASAIRDNSAWSEKSLKFVGFGLDDAVPVIEKIESVTGEPVFSEEQLLPLAIKVRDEMSEKRKIEDEGLENNIRELYWFNSDYVMKHLHGENLDLWIDSWVSYIRDMDIGEVEYVNQLKELIKFPLSDSQKSIALKVLDMAIDYHEATPIGVYRSSNWLANAEVHPENNDLVRDISELVVKKQGAIYKSDLFMPNALYSEGKYRSAIDTLIERFIIEKPSFGFGPDIDARVYEELISNRVNQKGIAIKLMMKDPAYFESALDALSGDDAFERKIKVKWKIALYRIWHEEDPETLVSKLVDLFEDNPDSLELINHLNGIASQLEDKPLKRKILNAQIALNPANKMYKIHSSQLYESQDHPIKALALRDVSESPLMAKNRVGEFDEFYRWIKKSRLEGDKQSSLQRLRSFWQGVRVTDGFPLKYGVGYVVELKDALKTDINSGWVSEDPDKTTVVELLKESGVGVEVLEDWILSLRGRYLETSKTLFEGLAEAYKKQEGGRERFLSLSELIRNGAVGDKEVQLWLSLAASDRELATSKVTVDIIDDQLIKKDEFLRYQLFLLARVYSLNDRYQDALKCYRSVAAATFGYVSSGTMQMIQARKNISVKELVLEAKQYLDKSTTSELIAELLALVEPPADDVGANNFYEQLVLELWHEMDDKKWFYQNHKALVDRAERHVLKSSERSLFLLSSLLEQAGFRARADEILKAYFTGKYKPYTTISVDGYKDILGIVYEMPKNVYRRSYAVESPVEHKMFDVLFHTSRVDWLSHISKAIAGWLTDEDTERDKVLLVLSELSGRLNGAGKADEAFALMDLLEVELESHPSLAIKTRNSIIRTSYHLGRPVDLNFQKKVLDAGHLDVDQYRDVIQLIENKEGESTALETGLALLEVTLNDDFMKKLIELAEKLGDDENHQMLMSLRAEANAAREVLESLNEA